MTEKTTKKCNKCEKIFLIIPQEKDFYDNKNLPTPSQCHECRRTRRGSLRNERKLYKRNCDKCDTELISTYPSDTPYIVYCETCYYHSI